MTDGDSIDRSAGALPAEPVAGPPAPTAPADLRAIADSLRMNGQVLQVLHETHHRLVQLLEKGDRSDVVVQSTEALNKTFRRLHESQEQLAHSLAAERRRSPRRTALAAILAAVAVGGLAWLGWTRLRGELERESVRLAEAHAEIAAAGSGARADLARVGSDLLDAVDRNLASNRVLGNENRAQHAELAELRERVRSLEEQLLRESERAGAATAERARIEGELGAQQRQLDEARAELVQRDLLDAERSRLLEAATAAAAPRAEPTAPAPAAAAPAPGGPPVPEFVPPIVAAVNRFLADAGVLDLRLLRCDGASAGALANACFEVRSAEGFPIGVHQAERARLRIREAQHAAFLELESGETVLRGQRTPFNAYTIALPAPPPGAAIDPELAAVAVVEPAPAAAADTAAPAAPPIASKAEEQQPAFDAARAVARLNARLRADGCNTAEFATVAGRDGLELAGVRMHQYDDGGALVKTVVAGRLQIQVDARERSVRLRFFDGHHVVRGREVPFFQGAGDTRGSWSLDLVRADPAAWSELLESL